MLRRDSVLRTTSSEASKILVGEANISRLASGAGQDPVVDSTKIYRPRRESVVRILAAETVIDRPASESSNASTGLPATSSIFGSFKSTSSRGAHLGDESVRGGSRPQNSFSFGRKLWHQFKASTLETLEQDPEIADNVAVGDNDVQLQAHDEEHMKIFKQFCTTVVADDYFSAFLDYLHSSSALQRLTANMNTPSSPARLMRQRSRRSSVFSASAASTSAFSSISTKFSDTSAEFDPMAQKFVLPPKIEDCSEGIALSHAYGVVLFHQSNHKFLARERAFFEIFHRFSTILAFKTVPPHFRPQLAQEIARIGRTNSFNSQRRIQESYQDTDVEKSTSRQVYDMREVGRSSTDTRVINALNTKRKAIHPHISVTGMFTLQSRSPIVSVKFPAAHEQLQKKLSQMEATKSRHMSSSSSWSLSQKSAKRPPFDPYFNTGRGVGAASQADLLAATARAQGGVPEWKEAGPQKQVLSPDKLLFHRLTGPFTKETLTATNVKSSSDSREEDRFMPLQSSKKKRPQALQLDTSIDFDRRSSSGSERMHASSSMSSVDSGNLSPLNRRMHLLSQSSFGHLSSPIAAASRSQVSLTSVASIPDPEFEPGHVIETGRIPHYLVGRERSLLRQAIDDHALEADVRRLEERVYRNKVSLQALHKQRAQRRKKKALDVDNHTAPKPRTRKAGSPTNRKTPTAPARRPADAASPKVDTVLQER